MGSDLSCTAGSLRSYPVSIAQPGTAPGSVELVAVGLV